MKDYMKNVLESGDMVIFAEHHGRNSGASLNKGTIVGFTEKFVKIEVQRPYGHLNNVIRISPEKTLKINGN
jgi:hypothetical protein